MSEALKPCPFCGGANVEVFGPIGWTRRFGISHSCHTFYGGSGDFTIGGVTKDQAIAQWNRRADLSPTTEQIMSDPNAVHINMLHGRIANPSVEQIVHIYAGKVQAVSVEPTPAQIMADPRVQALVDAGEVMAKALRGDYIVPGSAKAWDAALAQIKEHKP